MEEGGGRGVFSLSTSFWSSRCDPLAWKTYSPSIEQNVFLPRLNEVACIHTPNSCDSSGSDPLLDNQVGDTIPVVLPICMAIGMSSLFIGNPCNCTQKFIEVKFKLHTYRAPSRRRNKTKCLSKLHGSREHPLHIIHQFKDKKEQVVPNLPNVKTLASLPNW